MKYLGIDYGVKRVGLSVSDDNGRLAFPLDVLKNDKNLIARISEICRERKIEEIIVGESKNFQGEANPIMSDIICFSEKLKDKLGMSVRFEPEFMTSVEAGRVQKKEEKIDASAAAIILQSFLNRQNNVGTMI